MTDANHTADDRTADVNTNMLTGDAPSEGDRVKVYYEGTDGNRRTLRGTLTRAERTTETFSGREREQAEWMFTVESDAGKVRKFSYTEGVDNQIQKLQSAERDDGSLVHIGDIMGVVVRTAGALDPVEQTDADGTHTCDECGRRVAAYAPRDHADGCSKGPGGDAAAAFAAETDDDAELHYPPKPDGWDDENDDAGDEQDREDYQFCTECDAERDGDDLGRTGNGGSYCLVCGANTDTMTRSRDADDAFDAAAVADAEDELRAAFNAVADAYGGVEARRAVARLALSAEDDYAARDDYDRLAVPADAPDDDPADWEEACARAEMRAEAQAERRAERARERGRW